MSDPDLTVESLLNALTGLDADDVHTAVAELPTGVVDALLTATGRGERHPAPAPADPTGQALELNPRYRVRPHLRYLADRVTAAVRDVETGRSRYLAVSMPPRMGKSMLLSWYTPLWLLRLHPDWKIVTASHDPQLVGGWARALRRTIETHPQYGVRLSPDSGAGTVWETVEGGGMFSTSVRGQLTGRGARVLLLDDPVKDFVEAHSPVMREALWNWWLTVAYTRLEPPALVVTVMTRWHADDIVGRLLSPEHEGDPAQWEVINLPALAEPGDVLGRAVGEPLLSPLLDEDPAGAVARWEQVRATVGGYTFAAMYQGRPSPATGSVFDVGWWSYWTTDPGKATDDGRVRLVNPGELTGRWLDSWDCAFKGGDSGSWVVGQRWVRAGADRYLIAQQRGRWSFTQTLDRMLTWADSGGPHGHLVHERLVEDKANGTAIIDVLRAKVAGMKPINPTTSKEARARSVTPEVESGNVFLPHPGDPGNEWVRGLLEELREFPNGEADDQVDALTQALTVLRDAGRGGLTVPGGQVPRPAYTGAGGWGSRPLAGQSHAGRGFTPH